MNFWKEGVKENDDPVRDTGDGGGFSSDSLQGVLRTQGCSSPPQESPAPELHCHHPPHLQEESALEGERRQQGNLVLPLPVAAGPTIPVLCPFFTHSYRPSLLPWPKQPFYPRNRTRRGQGMT